MHWPADHAALADAALFPWHRGADELCPSAVVRHTLRYLPGRRVATMVDTADGPGVLKVFASPRARGNDRRLRALTEVLPNLVPTPRGVDQQGHVSLVSFTAGTVFDQLDDEAFIRSAPLVGAALGSLHRSGGVLDRCWTIDDELTQLGRRFPENVAAMVTGSIAARDALAAADLVSAHRDCHPRQVVVQGDSVAWIDLDDAAMAPAALDVGNFVAHLRRDAVIAERDQATTDAAIDGFLAGYGAIPADSDEWERLSLARLAGLAVGRHHRPDWAAAIEQLLKP